MSNSIDPCRVCLGEAARYIFQPNTVNDERCSLASINDIAEKLRFVSMLPVSEDDGLPLWICELCIIQLNLAYNFKRNVIATNHKLRGHFIDINHATTDGADTARVKVDLMDEVTDPADNRSASASSSATSVEQEPQQDATVGSHRLINIGGSRSAVGQEVVNVRDSPGMVMLNGDTAKTNPVEDQAFIQSFIKDHALLPCVPNSSSRVALETQPATNRESRPLAPKGSCGKKRTMQMPKPFKVENMPNNSQSFEKKVSNGKKNKRKRSTGSKRSALDESVERARKLSIMWKSLKIDMVTEQLKPQSPVQESAVHDSSDLAAGKQIRLRRRSICVPSFFDE